MFSYSEIIFALVVQKQDSQISLISKCEGATRLSPASRVLMFLLLLSILLFVNFVMPFKGSCPFLLFFSLEDILCRDGLLFLWPVSLLPYPWANLVTTESLHCLYLLSDLRVISLPLLSHTRRYRFSRTYLLNSQISYFFFSLVNLEDFKLLQIRRPVSISKGNCITGLTEDAKRVWGCDLETRTWRIWKMNSKQCSMASRNRTTRDASGQGKMRLVLYMKSKGAYLGGEYSNLYLT
jgi:hypothetical protein